jgi:spore germination protein YaaH
MEKALSLILVTLIAFSMLSVSLTQVKAQETILFFDDFESYAIGTRPSPPWEFWFGQDGEIVSSTYVSPTRSLRLLGSWAWSTEAIRRFTSSATIIGYEVYGKVEGFGKPYASLTVAFVKWTSPTTSDVVAGVSFWYDGTIIVAGRKPIGTYEPGKWYKIKVLFDRNYNTYDVWVDDVLKASSVPTSYANPYDIEGFAVMSEWAEVSCYFDDVKVFETIVLPSLYTLHVQSNPVTGIPITYKIEGYVAAQQTNFDIIKESPFTVILTAPLSYANYKFSYWVINGVNIVESNSVILRLDNQCKERTVVAIYEKVRRFFGWVFSDAGPKYTSGNTLKDFYDHVDQFKFVSPDWYIVNNSGKIVDRHFDFDVDYARKNGVLVLPKFGNQENPDYTKIFGNDTIANSTADMIADFVSAMNVDGVNIDFESIPNGPWLGVNNHFTTFIKRLVERLHLQSKIVTVAVEVGWGALWAPAIDYKALGEVVDYLIPMVYPYRSPWPFSNLKPVCESPTWWMRDWANRFINTYKVPSEKLIIAIPVYGVDWTKKTPIFWEPTPVTFNQAESITNNRAKGKWDEGTGTWSYDYRDQNGIEHKLWYPISRSVKERIDILSSMGIKYIAIWAVGQEDPSIWNIGTG